ncbi:hypothetical protein RB595_004750 [Gaeumannomyces hyphopodioides]
MAASRKAIQGHGVIILNIFRGLNICSLILVAAAHWIMIVTSGMSGRFHFFDFATHLFVFALTILLFMTELGVPANFIDQRWPVFGENAGFLVLGGLQIAMGCLTLADMEKPAYYVDSIGLPLWRTILAAGILSVVFGFVNIAATFFFEDRNAHISARMVRDNGLLAKGNDENMYAAPSHHGSSINSYSVRHEKDSAHGQQPGVWAQRAKRLTNAFAKKPSGGYDAQAHPTSRDGVGRGAFDNEEDIGVKPPATSIHPLYRRTDFDDGLGGHQRNGSGNDPRYTRYSTSSRISQFSEPPPLPSNATMPAGPYDNLPGGRI